MSEEQIEKYREMSVKFIENNRIELFRIYLQHSKSSDNVDNVDNVDNSGILVINFFEVESKNKVDVSYVPMNILDIDIVEKINERKENNDENIIYIFLITPYEEKIIEIDIRTLSN